MSNATRTVTEPLVKVKVSDHSLVTRYLVGAVFQLGYFQRPGVSSNMTIEEYQKVVDVDEDHHLIAVNNMHIVPGKCGIEWWRNEHDERLLVFHKRTHARRPHPGTVQVL